MLILQRNVKATRKPHHVEATAAGHTDIRVLIATFSLYYSEILDSYSTYIF